MRNSFTLEADFNRWVIIYPNQCPVCHHMVVIQETPGVSRQGTKAQVVYLCPNEGCKSFFIGYYNLLENGDGELRGFTPRAIMPEDFSDAIHQVSPMFISIYAEAHQAKQGGLLQIAGPGFRKAFEFLVKDYAKSLVPDGIDKQKKQADIENVFVGQVLNKYISDLRIQAVAKRALWVGNDETHYLRKWDKHTIDDLIALIKLTIHWIDMDQLSKQYIEDMPEK